MAKWLVERVISIEIEADTENQALEQAEKFNGSNFKILSNKEHNIAKLDKNGNKMERMLVEHFEDIWYTPLCRYALRDCILDPGRDTDSKDKTCSFCEGADCYDDEDK